MTRYLICSLISLAATLAYPPANTAGGLDAGFLVVAPDRGFLGNQEIRSIFDEFRKSYSPASLAWVGRDYNGIGSEHSVYLQRAVSELEQAGATTIVAIPMFLSKADPVLKQVITHLPSYLPAERIRWAPPMADSYLIQQILLDRVNALSHGSDQERLLVVGFGGRDPESAAAMELDLTKLLQYVTRHKRFLEQKVLLYYDREANSATEHNKILDLVVQEMAAKKGRTLLVLASMGPKYDRSMALTKWFGQKFRDLQLVYSGEELLPHPNVLRWLMKTANAYRTVSPAEVGVVVMPHGATQPWNDAVAQVIAPLTSKYRIETVYGMGDPELIQEAVSRLEDQGLKRIVFVRMYALSHHLKDRIDYILGLRDTQLSNGHAGHDPDTTPPQQVRSAALFSTFGGYEEYPAIAQVLHERIMEISRDPGRETVLLVSHGDKRDEDNSRWLEVMRGHIEVLRKDPHCSRLKAIRAATVREDWPELREQAVSEIRRMIQEDGREGRVLVIADRLYGAGPYRRLFLGLDFTLNDKGLAHPTLTRWLESGITKATMQLVRPQIEVEHNAGIGTQ